LGVRNLSIFSYPLLERWLWHYVHERETLLKLKEEVVVCLERLDTTMDGLLGNGPKIKVVDLDKPSFQDRVPSFY